MKILQMKNHQFVKRKKIHQKLIKNFSGHMVLHLQQKMLEEKDLEKL